MRGRMFSRKFNQAELRAAFTELFFRKLEFETGSDEILPHEIPKSGSFNNWMRNEKEANQFKLHNRIGQ